MEVVLSQQVEAAGIEMHPAQDAVSAFAEPETAKAGQVRAAEWLQREASS